MPSVLISGLGLMGGSLAAALSQAGWTVLLHHRRSGPAETAAARGWGRPVASMAEAASAELAVVCVPVGVIPGVVRELARETRAVITDVGSAKAGICRELADLGGRFVGSHPMCGSHRQGVEAGDADLYRGRLAITTPTPDTPVSSLAAVEGLWQAAGCRILRLDPAAHDRAVAEASHLPHVMACCTAAGLGPAAAAACAGGFRDTTRVAASSPQLWAEILLANATAVWSGIEAAEARLAELRRALAGGDRQAVEAWLEAGRAGRQLYERAQPG